MFPVSPSSIFICYVYAINDNRSIWRRKQPREGGRWSTWLWLYHIYNECIVTARGGNRNELKRTRQINWIRVGQNRFHMARRGNWQSINDTVWKWKRIKRCRTDVGGLEGILGPHTSLSPPEPSAAPNLTRYPPPPPPPPHSPRGNAANWHGLHLIQ